MTRASLAFWCKIALLLGALCEVSHGQHAGTPIIEAQCQPGQFCPLDDWRPAAGPLVAVPRTSSAPPQVVRIRNAQGNQASLGSGTLVDCNDMLGLVLSCGHLFREGVGTVTVTFPDGKQYGAKVLEVDQTSDLSALLIQAPGVEPWNVAEAAPRPGEAIYSAGYGERGLYAINAGTVRGYYTIRGDEPGQVLSISGAARQGDSGGPMFNARHQVVGVLFGTNGTVVEGTCCLRIRRFLQRHSRRFAKAPAVRDEGKKQDEPKPQAEPPPTIDPPAPKFDPRLGELEKSLAERTAELQTAQAERAAAEAKLDAAAGEQKALNDQLAAALAAKGEAQAAGPVNTKTPLDAAVQGVAAKGFAAVLTPWLGPFAGIAGSLAAGVFGALWLRARGKLKKRLQGGNLAEDPPTHAAMPAPAVLYGQPKTANILVDSPVAELEGEAYREAIRRLVPIHGRKQFPFAYVIEQIEGTKKLILDGMQVTHRGSSAWKPDSH